MHSNNSLTIVYNIFTSLNVSRNNSDIPNTQDNTRIWKNLRSVLYLIKTEITEKNWMKETGVI